MRPSRRGNVRSPSSMRRARPMRAPKQKQTRGVWPISGCRMRRGSVLWRRRVLRPNPRRRPRANSGFVPSRRGCTQPRRAASRSCARASPRKHAPRQSRSSKRHRGRAPIARPACPSRRQPARAPSARRWKASKPACLQRSAPTRQPRWQPGLNMNLLKHRSNAPAQNPSWRSRPRRG